MKPVTELRRRAVRGALIAAAILTAASAASAQSLGELNRRVNQLEPQVSEGASNPAVASEAITQLDAAEADFARLAEGARASSALLSTYDQLEGMLNRMYTI